MPSIPEHFRSPNSPDIRELAVGSVSGAGHYNREYEIRQTYRVQSSSVSLFLYYALGNSEIKKRNGAFYIDRSPPAPYPDLAQLGEPFEDEEGVELIPVHPVLTAAAARVSFEEYRTVEPEGLGRFSRLGNVYMVNGVPRQDVLPSTEPVCRVQLFFRSQPYSHKAHDPTSLIPAAVDDYGNPCDVAYEPSLNTTWIDRYISRFTEGRGEVAKLPFGKTYQVDVPGSQIAYNGIASVVPQQDRIYVWHDVPAIHAQAPLFLRYYTSFIGCVNSERFDEAPPGTLLLSSIEVTPNFNWDGQPQCNLIYRMQYLNRLYDGGEPSGKGHNSHYFWDQTSKVYTPERYSIDGTTLGRSRCDYRRFAKLFQVPNPFFQ